MNVPKVIRQPLAYNEEKIYKVYELEEAHAISKDQLNNAKLFSSRKDYVETLNKNISYLEVGVLWGNSAKMIINTTNAKNADLLDYYNGAPGILQDRVGAPKNSSITHEQHIKNKFAYHPNVNTIKGDAREILSILNKKYDFIFLDIDRDRFLARKLLLDSSKLTNVGGVIGLTSYLNYDSVLYEGPVGIYQSVNEFLHYNRNWSVDGLLLNTLGFHDIYIKKNKDSNQ